jgi:large repetitive protein
MSTRFSFLVLLTTSFAVMLSGCGGGGGGGSKSTTPTLTITTTSLPSGSVETAYSATVQSTGGTAPITWSIASGSLPAGLSLNASTGAITGTPTAAATSNITFQAADSGSPQQTAKAALSITISAATTTLTITTTSLPNGSVSTSYSATLQSTGGTAPITWSITSGNLPTGLSLSGSTGAITGTPTATGTSNITFQATDSSSSKQTAKATLSLTINQLAITTTSLLNPMVGEPYTQTLQYVDTGGMLPVTWSVSSGSLPSGFTLDSSTGAITGTATTSEVGTTNFTVQLVDSSTPPQKTIQPLNLTITTATACGSGNEALLTGQYAISVSGFDSSGPYGFSASFAANGTGTITSGVEDINTTGPSGLQTGVSITSGSYSVGSDNRGCVTLVAGGLTQTFRFALGLISGGVSGGGRTIEFDNSGANATGVIRIQASPSVSGSYGFSLASPLTTAAGGGLFAATGVLTLSGSSGTGVVDVNANGTMDDGNAGYPGTPITLGSVALGSIDPTTGRGTLSFTVPTSGTPLSISVVVYALNTSQFLMMSSSAQSATSPLSIGDAQLQSGSFTLSSMNAPNTLFGSGQTTSGTGSAGYVEAGVFSPDGNGNFTFSGDQNSGGTIATESMTGTYTVATNGRVLVYTGGSMPVLLFYLVTANKGFVLFTDSHVMSGFAEPQIGGPFTNASLTGTYVFATTEPEVEGSGTSGVALTSGVATYNAAGTVTGTFDYNQLGFLSLGNAFSQTYAVSSNGRVLAPATGTPQTVTYIIFPGKLITIDYNSAATNPTVSVMEQ